MSDRPRLVGVNHVALAVDDLQAALAFWRAIFDFELRGEGAGHAFLDMGDQFIALAEAPGPKTCGGRDDARHFGLVVDDRARVKELALAAGAEVLDTEGCDIIDPWGNWLQIIEYRDIQFAKTPGALRKLAVDGDKTDAARDQIEKKGMT